MQSRLCLVLTALLASVYPAVAMTDGDPAANYTLQVAAFPTKELADEFVVQLVRAGERPICATVELQGRGYWTRVFVGLFITSDDARRYGEKLVARGTVKEFLVKRADLSQAVTRPRRVTSSNTYVSSDPTATPPSEAQTQTTPAADSKLGIEASKHAPPRERGNRNITVRHAGSSEMYDLADTPLPDFRATALKFVPRVETNLIPRPDAVSLAIKLIVGGEETFRNLPQEQGGLWVTGDVAEALARLRWIVGEENAGLIKLDQDGRVVLDKTLLRKTSGLEGPSVGDPLQVADYVTSNEGLLLIVQMAESRYRYRLYIGHQAPTYGKSVTIAGSINLDGNFDSRINPYRKHNAKLDSERPPEGFDSLVGLNPIARWFNLATNSMVPVGEIAFHELAEAHAKIELGLDYLEQGSRPGAHATALERERRLQSQRPDEDIVLTAGSNRVLRTEEEIRLFFAEASAGVSQR